MAWNIVVAGGGFGGLAAARELEKVMPKQSARLMLVNETNYLTYTPFLPEAAAGTLEPRHVVTPLREILKRTYIRLGEIVAHDPAAKTVELKTKTDETETVPYDQLLLSLGSVSRVLPIPGLTDYAMGFKGLADAIVLRNRIIENLEAANATADHQRREELLTFVFVGGGYAGLEALAELQDFAADAMDSYPRARLHGMRWILVEAAPRVLPEIDQDLADYALRELRGRGIDIKLETQLKEVAKSSVTLSTGEVVPTTTVVWTAGVAPAPILKQLNLPLDERGRVPVDDHLRVEGLDSVWAIGDCAAAPDPRGGTCPPTAQHAVRQGPVVARNIAAQLGIGDAEPFTYRSEASFVNLGRYKAVGRIGDRKFRGFPAWFLARSYHMSQIPGYARKAHAILDWTASLPFKRDIAELGSVTRPKRLGYPFLSPVSFSFPFLPPLPPLPPPPLYISPPPPLSTLHYHHCPLRVGTMGANGIEYLFITLFFGLTTAIIGKAKGSSFCIWLWSARRCRSSAWSRWSSTAARGTNRNASAPAAEGSEALRPGLPPLRNRALPARPPRSATPASK